MAYTTRQKNWQDELWNVSLLPTIKTAQPAEPPHGPGPAGGHRLANPALLSISEDPEPRALSSAA